MSQTNFSSNQTNFDSAWVKPTSTQVEPRLKLNRLRFGLGQTNFDSDWVKRLTSILSILSSTLSSLTFTSFLSLPHPLHSPTPNQKPYLIQNPNNSKLTLWVIGNWMKISIFLNIRKPWKIVFEKHFPICSYSIKHYIAFYVLELL
jgi:hypothetical protein